jgi:hypothetical protein
LYKKVFKERGYPHQKTPQRPWGPLRGVCGI